MTPRARELLHRIERDLERDRRNQSIIDGMKRLPWHARFRVAVCRTNWILLGAALFTLALWVTAGWLLLK